MIRALHPLSGPPIEDLPGYLMADSRPPHPHRPWVLTNMISSLDGAATVGGGATGLTDPDDQALFKAFRSVVDVIVVGASTVRIEDYGPVIIDEDTADARQAGGASSLPRLAIISSQLDLTADARVFEDPTNPPLIITDQRAPAGRRRDLEAVAEIVEAGESSVNVGRMMRFLADRGAGVVLCEGGPTLNGHLVAADLIDEWNLSLSPLLVAGTSGGLARGTASRPALSFRLDRILAGDHMLFTRYLRATP